jgi:starch phosphorylase
VELLHGPISAGDEIARWEVVRMDLKEPAAGPGLSVWEGSFVCDTAGRHGFTVRVVPLHPDLVAPAEMGCAAWAKSV